MLAWEIIMYYAFSHNVVFKMDMRPMSIYLGLSSEGKP